MVGILTLQISNVAAVDLSKPPHGSIDTGIGFLDHMIDQLNSHAQVGVSIHVMRGEDDTDGHDKNRNTGSSMLQESVMSQVGYALGGKLNILLKQSVTQNSVRTSRFCCPLDEALVECCLVFDTNIGSGKLERFTLAPYGLFPLNTGRTEIGKMKTAYIKTFFENLAVASGLSIHLLKIRGKNGHHIVESAFKAFSRALRNLLDGVDTTMFVSDEEKLQTTDCLWGKNSFSFQQGIAQLRSGSSRRSTKETSIDVELKLDGGNNGINIQTGIQTLDSFFKLLAEEAWMSLKVTCNGDLWVDDHHSSEDVAIAVGKNLNEALGTKAGLNRMWCAESHFGQALVEVVMDLSNRPCLTHNLSLSDNSKELEYAGDLSIEMFEHVLDSLVMNGQMTVHVVQKSDNNSPILDLVMATGKAFGMALRLCMAVDPRRAGATASSKGTLSV